MQKEFIDEIIDALKNDVEENMMSDIYTDIDVDKTKCPLIAVNRDGVFILAEGSKDDIKKVHDLTPMLHLTGAAYVWLISDDQDYYYDTFEDECVPVEDIYVSFFSVYYNVLAGLASYKKSLVAIATQDEMCEVDIIEHDPALNDKRIDVIKTSVVSWVGREDEKRKLIGAEYKMVNGIKYIRKADAIGREQWYPINEDVDAEKLYKYCLYGGIVGAHKFAEGRVIMGLLYLISLGCFGVMWISDVLAMLGNNYRLRDGSYLGRIEKNKHNLLSALAGFAVSAVMLIALMTAYKAGLSAAQSIIMKVGTSQIAKEAFSNLTDEQSKQLLEQYGITAEDAMSMSSDELQDLSKQARMKQFVNILTDYSDTQKAEFYAAYNITTDDALKLSYDELMDHGIILSVLTNATE